MAFEYGSEQLGIKNPFKVEGGLRSVRGAITIMLGVFLLLDVSDLTQNAPEGIGWAVAITGLVFLLNGFTLLTIGLMQVLRFFVGRSVPLSLATNYAKSEVNSAESGAVKGYNDKDLEQMLMGRKNLTFKEPTGILAHFVHTLVPSLLFMPYPFRNLAMRVASAIAYTLIAFIAFGLAWFSGASGLTNITQTPVLDYLGLILLVILIVIWMKQGNAVSRQRLNNIETISIFKMVLITILSIITPVALTYIHVNIEPLVSIENVGVAEYVMALMGFVLLASTALITLLIFRSRRNNPKTTVSEFRDNWQRSVHPQEIFIHFENIIMANRRYREIPNRLYRDFDADLREEGGQDKGKFDGEMISETQPVFKDFEWTPIFKLIRLGVTGLGQLMLVTALVWGYFLLQDISELTRIDASTLQDSAQSFVIPLMTFIFGGIIAKGAHLFWAEMQFKSTLIYFRANGTYTESKISTGTAVYDSTRSENTVVRSSITPWIIVSKIISSTFVGSGSRNMEDVRHIMTLEDDDATLEEIKSELEAFFASRETIAGINETDLNAATQIHQMNEVTRAMPKQDNALLNNDAEVVAAHIEEQAKSETSE